MSLTVRVRFVFRTFQVNECFTYPFLRSSTRSFRPSFARQRSGVRPRLRPLT